MSASTSEPALSSAIQAGRLRVVGVLLGALTLLFLWWGWKQGAFFGSVFYPGAIAAFALLILLLVAAPFWGRVSGPALVALVALGGLAVWMGLSALWSPTPATAIAYAEHAVLYTAIFALGIWVAHLLGARMENALWPVAIAGACAGAATVFTLASGSDVTWYLQGDATLRFPIGYRNADAAFFLICLWPLLALAANSSRRWPIRALLIAAATVLIELELLTQSRGSLPAIAAAMLVFLAASPNRLRAFVVLGLASLPALSAVPALLDVYRHGTADVTAVPYLRDAARAIELSSLLSLAVASVAFRGVGPHLRLSTSTSAWLSRAIAVIATLVVLVGGVVFVSKHGGPIGFVDQRISQFKQIGYPNLHGQGIRFGANVGSNRSDFWRVSIDQGFEHPLAGGGGGSFRVAYLEHRRSGENPQDPHSVEMLMFAELGFVGLLLFGLFIGSAATGGWRSRRLGPAAALLSAGALASGTQWLVHSSFDWLWNYPGVTAPALFLLGAAAAPGLLRPDAKHGRAARLLAIGAMAAVALTAVPLFLSSRYEQRAYGESRDNPGAAIDDLDRAARLNPLTAAPLLSKGEIEANLGKRAAALAAFHEAIEREPDDYAGYYFLAMELARDDPPLARRYLRRALDLNPRDPVLKTLWRTLHPPAGLSSGH